MTRTYNRKTEKISKEIVIKAVNTLKISKRSPRPLSIRDVAAAFGVPKSSVFRYINQSRTMDILPPDYGVVAHPKQILSSEEEKQLVSYLKECIECNHSLVPTEIRKLVYTYALANEINCPDNWRRDEIAGRDWFSSFMKRNRSLSIRKPEATSQARAAGFNPVVVRQFQNNLERIFSRYHYPPHRIGNTDESSTPTVMTPTKVVALRGVKQVGKTYPLH